MFNEIVNSTMIQQPRLNSTYLETLSTTSYNDDILDQRIDSPFSLSNGRLTFYGPNSNSKINNREIVQGLCMSDGNDFSDSISILSLSTKSVSSNKKPNA